MIPKFISSSPVWLLLASLDGLTDILREYLFSGWSTPMRWMNHSPKPHNNKLQAVRQRDAAGIAFIFKFFFLYLEQRVPSVHGNIVVFRSLRSIKFNINC